MTTATNDQPWHAKCPNWVLPALVCGGAPSLLMLLATCVALVVWMFSGGSEPDVVQAASNPPADVAPAAAPPFADPAPTIREVASAAMPDVPPSDAPSAPRQLATSLDPADAYIIYLTGPD